MGFLDKVKSAANDMVSAAGDAVKGVSDKGKEMSEKSKLNRAVKETETRINNLYIVIGKKFFDANTTAPAGYEDQFNGIANAQTELKELKKELSEISSPTACPNCKAPVNPGQPFCQKCGAKLSNNSAPAQPVQSNTETVETVSAEVVQSDEN